MDITNIGSDTWSAPGASPQPDVINTFLEDTNKNKMANSIGDLLQLTRSRQARQFVAVPEGQEASKLLSASTPNLRTTTGSSPVKHGGTTRTRNARHLSSNPSRNPPPGSSYSIQERPPSKVEIDALEEQLSERLRTVNNLAQAELQAVETGELYQPHKDALILTKDHILKEFGMDEAKFMNEVEWMDKLVKCESLKQVCEGVATQLVDMVSVTSTGLGNVLRKLKHTYKQSFDQMKQSWVALHNSYHANTLELVSKSKLLETLKVDLAKQRSEMRQKVDEEIQHLTNVFEGERQRDKDQLIATEFQVDQMTATLKSLNGIFKTMQADSSAINASDLAFKCQRLEKEVEALSSQCMTLDKVKDELFAAQEKLAATEKSLQLKEIEHQALRIHLVKREEMVTQLMEKESLRNSEIEKLQKLVAEQSNQEEMDDFEEPPTSVLCIRCKKSLDDLGNIRAAIYGNNGTSSERIQCESFRILLPNLRGKQPHRTISWVRYCMRSVIISKMKEDVNLLGIHGELSRFPEYVYAWFERYAVGRNAVAAFSPQMPLVQQNAEIMQVMDEDRWGLYYGSKALAKDDPEAKLFWALLDESYGEDGLQFVMYCLSTILSMGGDELWLQFGNVLQQCEKYSSSVTAFSAIGLNVSEPNHRGKHKEKEKDTMNSSVALIMGGGKYGAGLGGGTLPVLKDKNGEVIPPLGKSRVYVQIDVALECVRHIMTKSGQSLQQAIDAIHALSIVPDVADPLQMRPGTPSAAPEGDEEASDKPKPKDPTHICLFTWLRIMLQRYTDDQAHRTASVNTMFEAASIGALTPAIPPGHQQGNAVMQAHRGAGPNNSIEFPQFQSVCRTLYPFVSIVECASLFTQTYYAGDKHVTPKAFMKVADIRGLFSRALRLAPLPLFREHSPPAYTEAFEANDDETIGSGAASVDSKEKHRPGSMETNPSLIRMHLGCLVHRRLASSQAGIQKLINDMPEKWRVLLTEVYYQASDALNEYKQTGKGSRGGGKKGEFGVTGHHHRSAVNPGSPGGMGPSGARDSNALGRSFYVDGIQPLVQYRKLLCISLLIKAMNDNPIIPGGLLTNSATNQLPTLSVNLVKADKLLDMLEKALYIDECGAEKHINFDEVRCKIVVRKLQYVYRNFIAMNPPVPRSLRFYMRPGYLRSTTNHIKKRQIIQDPWWAQTLIAEVLAFKLEYDMKASRLGHAHIAFPAAIASCLYEKFGCLEVSERAIHDLFVCIRAYHYCLPRLRLFGAFVGVGSLDEPVASILQTREAISLYLDLLIRVHHEIDLTARTRVRDMRQNERDLQAIQNAGGDALSTELGEMSDLPINMTEEVCGYSRTLGVFHIPVLFPSTEKEPLTNTEKKDSWAIAAVILEQAATKWAAAACLKASGGGTASGMGAAASTAANQSDAAMYGQLVYKLKIDRNRCAEVDDFLWLLIMHWARVTSLYTKKSQVKAAWIDKNKGTIVRGNQSVQLHTIPISSHQLSDGFQAVYGNSGFMTDSHHTSKLYIDYACSRHRKRVPNIESLMHQATLWDSCVGGGGINSFVASAASAAAAVAGGGMTNNYPPSGNTTPTRGRKLRGSTAVNDIVNRDSLVSNQPHVHDAYLNALGYDADSIYLFSDSGDNIMPQKLFINIHIPSSVTLSIATAKKNFTAYHNPINETLSQVSYPICTSLRFEESDLILYIITTFS